MLSYQDTPECKRDVLIAYLDAHGIKHVSDRCAALLIMITDKSLDQEQRRNFAFEIVQKHHNVRHQEPYRSFVDEVKKELSLSGDAGLEPDSQRWNREIGDDPESLLKVAAGFASVMNYDTWLDFKIQPMSKMNSYIDVYASMYEKYSIDCPIDRDRVNVPLSFLYKHKLELYLILIKSKLSFLYFML